VVSLLISRKDECIFALSLDGQFIRYITLASISKEFITDMNAFLNTIGKGEQCIKFDEISKTNTLNIILTLDLHDAERQQFEKIILAGAQREIIPLPADLAYSCSEHPLPVRYSHRDLSGFKTYWNNLAANSELELRLYQQLAEDLIEIPYPDAPKDYLYRFGKIACHTNHGTGHAIRHILLFNKYLDFVITNRSFLEPKISKEVILMTPEAIYCLRLAMFLFRAGRTNELGWSDDSTYSPRSAAIFKHIALSLGFSQELVHLIACCFDYEKSLQLLQSNGVRLDQMDRCFLYQKLFNLAHLSDLVRCYTKFGYLQDNLTKLLADLLTNLKTDKINEVASDFLLFAAKCCSETGAAIAVKELLAVNQCYYGFEKPWLIVKTANNVFDSFLSLNSSINELPADLTANKNLSDFLHASPKAQTSRTVA
jgi:hypothetical protein